MSSPSWAGPSGLPTRHAILAGLHVASLIDETGSLVADARESYWHQAAGGRFGPPDFHLGEQLLIDCGLAEQCGDRLRLLPEVSALLDADVDAAVAAVCARVASLLPPATQEQLAEGVAEVLSDPERREELLAAMGRRFDDSLRKEIGALGELIVVAALRNQLLDLGYPQLARAVRHISLETDQAGYDITAPTISGGRRLIEVKSTTALRGEEITFHISRNELEAGQAFREWSLVICEIVDLQQRNGSVVGWCCPGALAPLIPKDAPLGRWETAALTIARSDVISGLPAASG